MECVLLPAATAQIGCDATGLARENEQPMHEVRLDSFLVDVEPVSVGAFAPSAAGRLTQPLSLKRPHGANLGKECFRNLRPSGCHSALLPFSRSLAAPSVAALALCAFAASAIAEVRFLNLARPGPTELSDWCLLPPTDKRRGFVPLQAAANGGWEAKMGVPLSWPMILAAGPEPNGQLGVLFGLV